MEIGKLNQRIEIYESTQNVDSVGYRKNTWDKIYSCWTYVTVQTSDEQFQNGVTADKLTYVFYIRQNKTSESFTTTNNRIFFKGGFFDIISIENDFNSKDYLKLTAKFSKMGNNSTSEVFITDAENARLTDITGCFLTEKAE